MAAFNSCVRGSEGDGSASVAERENERRPSGTDARTKGLVRGIGAAATLVEGGGSCSCSGKKKVKVAFRFFMLFRMGGGNRQGTTDVRSAGPRVRAGPSARATACG
jgi:hypothetical protein